MAGHNYYNRLLRVVLGFITAMATGVLLTWSYYREPLMNLFPTWTTSGLSLIFSVHNVIVAVMMACSGFLLKKISTRTAYTLAAVFFLVGLGGFYFLPVGNPDAAFVLAFILYGILAPIGCGIAALLNYSVYPSWYPECSGLVSGLMLMAFNTCALVTGAIAGALLPSMGIRKTFLITGIIIFAAVMLSVPLGVFPKPEQKLPPAPVRMENQASRDFTTAEMLKTPAFWTIFLYHSFVFAISLILADHAAGIAKFFGAAALFGLLFAPAKGVSCLAIGWIMDKMSTFGAMLVIDVIVIGSAGLLLFAASTSSTILILIGLIILGFGIGGVSTIKAAAIRFFFGNKNYRQNYGLTNINLIVSSVIVLVASKIIEAMNGSYYGIFILILVIGAFALLCTVLLKLFMKRSSMH